MMSAEAVAGRLDPAPVRCLLPRSGGSAEGKASPSPPIPSPPAPAAASDGGGGDAAPATSSASFVIDFLTLCYHLKMPKRAGWVRHGVQEPELVADHMYHMGVMALIAADLPGVDRDRCMKMVIVHDIAKEQSLDLEEFFESTAGIAYGVPFRCSRPVKSL